jgi:hypothetical protein
MAHGSLTYFAVPVLEVMAGIQFLRVETQGSRPLLEAGDVPGRDTAPPIRLWLSRTIGDGHGVISSCRNNRHIQGVITLRREVDGRRIRIE